MALIHWAVYDGNIDPTTPDEVKTGVWAGSGNVVIATDTAPTITTQPFVGTEITGLSPSTTYKLAGVWSDGPNNSNVEITEAFVTLPAAGIKLGEVDVSAAYIGTQSVSRIYLGETQLL